MEFAKIDPQIIDAEDYVRLKEMGNVTEIMHSRRRSHGGCITRLDKDHYIDNRTGEYCEFRHIENRGQYLKGVAKSLARGRDIINANVTDVMHCRWLTCTYAVNMRDPKRLELDWRQCIKRLRKMYGPMEYITAAEPQGRGAWHLHVILIYPGAAPYMDNADVAQAWGQGFVAVRRLDNCDNVGAYLTAYLGDVELSAARDANLDINGLSVKEVEISDEDGRTMPKKYVKGARLALYPPGMHIFRWSKGIRQPDISYVRYLEAKAKASSGKLTFASSVELSDGSYSNVITYEYYNNTRK